MENTIGSSRSLIRSVLLACVVVAVSRAEYPPDNWVHYEKPTCSEDTPCYDVVLTLISDGPITSETAPGLLERRFYSAGADLDAALKCGRDAIEFFMTKYGITFPNITDSELLDNSQSVLVENGTAMFMPYVRSDSSRLRLYSGSVEERSQFYNLPISEYGFKVVFDQDFQANGTFDGIIPANATVFFGYYSITQCPHKPYYYCPTSILTPYRPKEKITISYRSQAYTEMNLAPTNYFITDYEISNAVWGKGTERGYFPLRAGSTSINDGRSVLTFPAYRP